MNPIIVRPTNFLNLSDVSKQEIDRKLPNASQQLMWLSYLPQEWIDYLAGPDSKLPIANVCLLDAAKVACQVDYALDQAYAHLIWFRKECPNAPQLSDAHYYGRFYGDDAALRLYSAAEHIANFIVAFLDIGKNDLKSFQKNNRVAFAAVVGNYLQAQQPNHPVTRIVSCLISDEWKLVEKYRNDWVHNKPPVLDGPGLDYKRINRWHTIGEANVLARRIRYAPDYTLDRLLDSILKAACDFKTVLSALTDMYFQEIETLGIKRDVNNGTITPPDNYWE
jgi:hypothetical protein